MPEETNPQTPEEILAMIAALVANAELIFGPYLPTQEERAEIEQFGFSKN